MLPLVIHTANILGVFGDPFEFDGDYGTEANQIRNTVFELVVSKYALTEHFSDAHIKTLLNNESAIPHEIRAFREYLLLNAQKSDQEHGPVLSELITPDLLDLLADKQNELQQDGFTEADLEAFRAFVRQHADEKLFYSFKNSTDKLLGIDHNLRNRAASEGKALDLPILSSPQALVWRTSRDLKKALIDALFTAENLKLAKKGLTASSPELECFTTPAGQLLYFWMYESLNLHLISEQAGLIDQVNRVKEIFWKTLGDPQVRAEAFREKLIAARSGVLFTQECDAVVPKFLTENGRFLEIDRQNPQDGTFVFLKSDEWEPDYTVIPIEGYKGYETGNLNVILATRKGSGEKFMLASCHGNSTKAEDGRLQIALVVEAFRKLSQKPEYKDLQLIIGIDANTKSDHDVQLLREHLESLGLVGTSVGPTTVKKRMVTVQHSKAGRSAIDEEDFLIILKDSRYSLTEQTVGFSKEKPDPNTPLPNTENRSDHYAVGATLQ